VGDFRTRHREISIDGDVAIRGETLSGTVSATFRASPDTVSLSFPNPDPVRLHNDQLTRVVLLGRMSQKEGDQLHYQGGSGVRAVQDLKKGDDTFEPSRVAQTLASQRVCGCPPATTSGSGL